MRPITEIFTEDQNDRKQTGHLDKDIRKRDRSRRQEVNLLLEAGLIKTGKEYFIAALIFHHGNRRTFKKALRLAEKSEQLGYLKAKSLQALIIDRILISKGKPQKFSTQYTKNAERDWELFKYDPSTTDKQRAEYNLPTLAKLKKQAKNIRG